MEYLLGWECKVGNALQPDSVQLHSMPFCCREAPMPLLFQEPVCQISMWLADQISGLSATYKIWASDRKGSEALHCGIFRDYETRAKSCPLYSQEGKIIPRNKTNCIHRNSIYFCQYYYSTLRDIFIMVVKFPVLPEWICTCTYNQAYGIIMKNKTKKPPVVLNQNIYLQFLIIWNCGSILQFYQVLSLKSNFQKLFVFCYSRKVMMIKIVSGSLVPSK